MNVSENILLYSLISNHTWLSALKYRPLLNWDSIMLSIKYFTFAIDTVLFPSASASIVTYVSCKGTIVD